MTDATIDTAAPAEIKSPYEKVLIALLAGFTPIILKYVSRDPSQEISLINFTYLWTGLALSLVGFIALYMTSEKSRMKLFAMAVSAPAVFSNMTYQMLCVRLCLVLVMTPSVATQCVNSPGCDGFPREQCANTLVSDFCPLFKLWDMLT